MSSRQVRPRLINHNSTEGEVSMPVFEYQCLECKKTYEVYHKGREITDDNSCPACGSVHYKKLMSAASLSTGQSSTASRPEACEGCSGDSCGLNY